MITNRTLAKWRKETLILVDASAMTSTDRMPTDVILTRLETLSLCEKLLVLTQELMDINLMKGVK
jgi:hypothetical protein